MFLRPLVIAIFSTLSVSPAFAARHVLTDIEKQVVSSWLSRHQGYRLASDRDCNCEEDLQKIRREGYGGRWKPVPNYHPYAVIGDFNGDGIDDIAVAVVRKNGNQRFTIQVFNGPLNANKNPSFTNGDSNMSGIGFFYGPPRPKPYRLVVGAFESEGYILIPKGQTYKIDAISTENE